jgi:tRNA(Ile)-lysidine synthase
MDEEGCSDQGAMRTRHKWVACVLGRVEATIREHELLARQDRVVVAVSGGPDSVALIHILNELRRGWGWDLAMAHLHHGLRGAEADEDLAFVEDMARNLGLPFLSRRLPAGSLRGTRGSLQENARRARYRFLEEVRAQWNGNRIALGHHGDDQAETVLAALIRGAGPHGLRGMPYRRGSLVRPLLDVKRAEILQYLDAQSLLFRRDPSNEDTAFLRPRVRTVLLPLLRDRFNPGVADLLRQTARICASEDGLVEALLGNVWARVARIREGEVEIPRGLFLEQPEALRWRLLMRAYRSVRGDARRLAFAHVAAMDRATRAPGGEHWLDLPRGVQFCVGGGTVLMRGAAAAPPRPFRHTVMIPGEIHVREAAMRIRWEIEMGQPSLVHSRAVPWVLMDPDAFSGEIVLRSPLPGDRLRPLGLGGTKKVHDVLVDAKVPRRDRWRVPVLADDRGVAWVVGHRMDERLRVGPETPRVLKATILPEKPDSP